MGGPRIGKLIKIKAPEAKQERDYSYYTGKLLVVDLMQWLYKFKIAIIEQPKLENITTCLWSRLMIMLKNGILAIFVIDGGSPILKQTTINKRKKSKEKAKNKLKELDADDVEGRKKYQKRCVYIKDSEIDEALNFLNCMGFPVVRAIEEADPQCAGITIAGKAYGVMSEDWDTFMFGGERMIKKSTKRGKFIEYDREVILKSLGVTQEQFVEIGMALGCDYCNPITITGYDKTGRNIDPI
jgi:flap endonuclease-1